MTERRRSCEAPGASSSLRLLRYSRDDARVGYPDGPQLMYTCTVTASGGSRPSPSRARRRAPSHRDRLDGPRGRVTDTSLEAAPRPRAAISSLNTDAEVEELGETTQFTDDARGDPKSGLIIEGPAPSAPAEDREDPRHATVDRSEHASDVSEETVRRPRRRESGQRAMRGRASRRGSRACFSPRFTEQGQEAFVRSSVRELRRDFHTGRDRKHRVAGTGPGPRTYLEPLSDDAASAAPSCVAGVAS